jgi:hypothetical protein
MTMDDVVIGLDRTRRVAWAKYYDALERLRQWNGGHEFALVLAPCVCCGRTTHLWVAPYPAIDAGVLLPVDPGPDIPNIGRAPIHMADNMADPPVTPWLWIDGKLRPSDPTLSDNMGGLFR